jgi:hypothetical protein
MYGGQLSPLLPSYVAGTVLSVQAIFFLLLTDDVTTMTRHINREQKALIQLNRKGNILSLIPMHVMCIRMHLCPCLR